MMRRTYACSSCVRITGRGCPVSETCKEFSPAPAGRASGQQTYRQQLTYEYKLHRLELEDEYGYYR